MAGSHARRVGVQESTLLTSALNVLPTRTHRVIIGYTGYKNQTRPYPPYCVEGSCAHLQWPTCLPVPLREMLRCFGTLKTAGPQVLQPSPFVCVIVLRLLCLLRIPSPIG